MANMNKVILAGRLTRDPQLSYLPSNTPVCEFGMAVNNKYKSQTGEWKEDTCFVDLRIFGRRAEVFNQYMGKGKPILVEGKLRFDQWEGKDGQKRSRLYVVVDNFEFIGAPGGARSDETGGPSRPEGSSNRPAPARTANRAPSAAPEYDEQPPMQEAPADEIPF
jgi:single-strand DNA-binding protein